MKSFPYFEEYLAAMMKRESFGLSAIIVLGLLSAVVVILAKDTELFLLFLLLLSIFVLTTDEIGLLLMALLSYYFLYVRYILSLPPLFINLIYVMLVVFFIKYLLEVIIKKRPIPRTPLDRTVILFCLFIGVSFLLNRPPLGAALKSIPQHVGFVLLFFVVAHSRLSNLTLKTMVYGILIVALIQVLASSIQFYIIYNEMPRGFRQDNSGGLFGPSSGDINAVFMVYVFSLLIGFIKAYGVKYSYLLFMVLIVVPVVLSSARAGLVFFMLTALFLAGSTPLLRGKLIKKDISLGIGLMVFLIPILILLGGRSQIGFITSPQAVYDYSISSGKRIGRIEQFSFVHSNIGQRAKTAILGFGPGEATPTKLVRKDSDTSGRFIDELTDKSLHERKSYSYITLELGYGGLILFLFLHYKLFMLNRTFFQAARDKFWRAISIGFAGIIFTSAYSIIYAQSSIKPAIVFPFWLLAGVIYRVGRIKGIYS